MPGFEIRIRLGERADPVRVNQMPHDELHVIGDALLAETLAVTLGGKMNKLGPLALQGRLGVAELPCETKLTTRAQAQELLNTGSAAQRMYAAEALRHLDQRGEVPSKVPIRVHTLWLTKGLAVVGIQGEVLVGLGAYVERSLRPSHALLLGYTNGCECYLPDSKELARGGYEQSSYLYHGWSGPIRRGVEKIIAAAAWRGGR